MTIYTLSQDHAETARWLDDRSLDKMIKDIAQVLCNVHWYIFIPDLDVISAGKIPPNLFQVSNIPLRFGMTQSISRWSQWARECRANYLWLVNLLDHLLWEQIFRFKKLHDGKYHEIFKWARDNVPDLPERVKIKQYIGAGYFGEIATDITPPVVMPSKYHALTPYSKPEDCGSSDGGLEIDVFESYRNYYESKLNKKIKSCKSCYGFGFNWASATYCDSCYPFFTRRQKPEWLKLEDA